MMMVKVSKVMTAEVVMIADSSLVPKAISKMVNGKIGSIILTDENDYLSGIFTESDLLRHLHKHMMDGSLDWLWRIPVKEVMSKKIFTITEDANCKDAIQLMSTHRIRRLPVMDTEDEELVGIITERDILAMMSKLAVSNNR